MLLRLGGVLGDRISQRRLLVLAKIPGVDSRVDPFSAMALLGASKRIMASHLNILEVGRA